MRRNGYTRAQQYRSGRRGQGREVSAIGKAKAVAGRHSLALLEQEDASGVFWLVFNRRTGERVLTFWPRDNAYVLAEGYARGTAVQGSLNWFAMLELAGRLVAGNMEGKS